MNFNSVKFVGYEKGQVELTEYPRKIIMVKFKRKEYLRFVIDNIRNSPFSKNMSIIMTGTAIAQIFGFLLSPVISRLFSPIDFGIYGSYNSVLSIIVTVVTLQYSSALMLPKGDDEAVNLFALSMLSAFVVSIGCFIFIIVFPNLMIKFLKLSQTKWLLFLLPIGILLYGVNQTVYSWCTRRKAFETTTLSQIIRAISVNALQILTGWYHYGSSGLIVSSVYSEGISGINMARQILVTDRDLFKRSLSWAQIIKLGKDYSDFPIYSATQNMMSAVSQGLPVLVLSNFFGIEIAGAYAFGIRIIQVPMTFILNALRQVLFQKASESYNNGNSLLQLFIKITSVLCIMATLPVIIVFLWAPEIFSWIFGMRWEIAGVYARWLIIWLFAGFCNTPAVLFAGVLRKQKELCFFEVIILVSRSVVLFGGGYFLSAMQTIIIFSIIGFMLNILLIYWVGRTIVRSEKLIAVSAVAS